MLEDQLKLEIWREIMRRVNMPAEPCCGEYETCTRACTPRGEQLAYRSMGTSPPVERSFEADRIAMQLTADLCALEPLASAREAAPELILRDDVMRLVMRWRAAWDKLPRDTPPKKDMVDLLRRLYDDYLEVERASCFGIAPLIKREVEAALAGSAPKENSL